MNDYRVRIAQDLADQKKSCLSQPVLFAGAGLSRRWIAGPSWPQLLSHLIDKNVRLDKPYTFYEQKANGDLPLLASLLVEPYWEWAWNEGRNSFPPDLFQTNQSKDIYLKYTISQFFKEISAKTDWATLVEHEEILNLQRVRPHAVITTNYDDMLERIFADYRPVDAREIVRSPYSSLGEILKIHGDASAPQSLVITSEDYSQFSEKRKYLSAKLLTYFHEHVVVFAGYSINDSNVRSILSDIDEAISLPGDLVSNLYFLETVNDESKERQTERLIQLHEGKSLRIKCIQAVDFSWVFSALSSGEPLENVNPKLLRAIMARTYHLVRSDLPKQKLKVDFEFIESKVSSGEDFATLFGISTLSSPTEVSAKYKYNLTEVGKKLGFPGWHRADAIIKQIYQKSGKNIKASDNEYHMCITTGKSKLSKYSEDCVKLLSDASKGIFPENLNI